MNATQEKGAFFAEFPDNSRIWIYQASRLLTNAESATIRDKAKTFTNGWNAHKVPLTADADVIHNLFLVLIADEVKLGASGCSIDSSVHFVKTIGQEFQLDFFDRLNVAYKNENGVWLANYQQLIEDIKTGKTAKNVEIFNNVIQTKRELETSWLIPMETSWLAKFL